MSSVACSVYSRSSRSEHSGGLLSHSILIVFLVWNRPSVTCVVSCHQLYGLHRVTWQDIECNLLDSQGRTTAGIATGWKKEINTAPNTDCQTLWSLGLADLGTAGEAQLFILFVFFYPNQSFKLLANYNHSDILHYL